MCLAAQSHNKTLVAAARRHTGNCPLSRSLCNWEQGWCILVAAVGCLQHCAMLQGDKLMRRHAYCFACRCQVICRRIGCLITQRIRPEMDANAPF